MVVKVNFTPLYGVHTQDLAVAYLLTIDGFNILLDCGWTSAYDPTYLHNLAKVAPSVHVVLLSHPDIPHLGALPYAVANLGLDAPIFSTLPVWRMGQMFMYDAFLSLEAQRPFDVFNLDHVDAAFEISPQPDKPPRYHLLKYQQRFPLDSFAGGKGIVITPHAAGHMLGGTVWNITKDMESIVYAVNFNHRRERHLNPTTLQSFSRPSHLIVGTAGALTRTETKRTGELLDRIKSVVKYRGNVLIPVDTAGRVIELAILLHDAWSADHDLSQIPLVILHDLSTRTFEFARSMIEWMSDEVVRKFDVSRENLFVFKHVKLCQTLKDLEAMSTPMVVLASSVSMEMGFARRLFAKWSQDPRNAVILTDRPEPNTLYHKLYHHYKEAAKSRKIPPLRVRLMLGSRVYLQGQELEDWRESERERLAQEEEVRRKEEEEREEKEGDGIVDSRDPSGPPESGEKQSLRTVSLENTPKVAKTVSELLQSPEQYEKHVYAQLQRLGIVPSKPEVPMFSFPDQTRPSWDDYGQILDTTRFMIGEDPGEGAPNRNIDNSYANGETTGDLMSAQENIPTKYVEEVLDISVRCLVHDIDNSGQSDGDSLKRLVKEVEPRHVTLVSGTDEETAHFKQYLLSSLYRATNRLLSEKTNEPSMNDSTVISPTQMEAVDITSHTFVLEVKLQDALVAGLSWNHVGFADVAFLDAVVQRDSEDKEDLILKSDAVVPGEEIDQMDIETTTRTLTKTLEAENSWSGHPTVFVGTIMLNRLKDILTKAGIKAEFAGGALCVENVETGAVVLLKKVGAQHVMMEGAFSEEYFSVRDLLYEELVIPQ